MVTNARDIIKEVNQSVSQLVLMSIHIKSLEMILNQIQISETEQYNSSG